MKLTNLYVIEAPTDWKRTFNNIAKADRKRGDPLAVGKQSGGQYHVPKTKGKSDFGRPVRGGFGSQGVPSNDPTKAGTGEIFQAKDGGRYFLYKTVHYEVLFVNKNNDEVEKLGDFFTRQEAVDALLEDHDKRQGGV